jgi:uncharacterized membrane protein
MSKPLAAHDARSYRLSNIDMLRGLALLKAGIAMIGG